MLVPNLRTSITTALLPILLPLVQALQRTIGDPKDERTQTVVNSCLGRSTPSSPVGFQYGSCAALIMCVVGTLESDITSGLQSGGTIASLLPTILALVGVPSEEIVQLTFTSPHRALATCIFGINLPKRLFVQLRGHDDRPSDKQRRREWSVRVPSKKSTTASMAKTLIVDFFIVGIAAIMVWRHAVVGFQTMVTWRCEYSWLVLCWPIACAVWLLIVFILLHIFASEIKITSPDNKRQSRIGLLLLPYRGCTDPSPSQVELRSSNGTTNTTGAFSPNSCWKIAVTMRHLNGWGWFETITDTLAVGIYLYATFVLSSLLFLSGQQAIIYATVMTLGQSAIRVLEAL